MNHKQEKYYAAIHAISVMQTIHGPISSEEQQRTLDTIAFYAGFLDGLERQDAAFLAENGISND